MKIGIWAIYENGNFLHTIKPNEGIGVYLYNILEDFKDDSLNVKVFCLKKDKDLFEHYLDSGIKFKFVNTDNEFNTQQNDLKKFNLFLYIKQGWINLTSNLKPTMLFDLLNAKPPKKIKLIIFLFAFPILFFLHVFDKYLRTTYQICKSIIKQTVRLLLAKQNINQNKLMENYFDQFTYKKNQIKNFIINSDCDVWLVPTIYNSFPSNKPFLLFVFDMVTWHFPECFDRPDVFKSYRYALRNSAIATKVGCMSDFIRQTDLIKTLEIEKSKIEVIEPALPNPVKNLREPHSNLQTLKKHKYLYYPTVMRQHKNITNLILALKLLRMDQDYYDYKLVLTLPGNLKESQFHEKLIRRLGLIDDVIILGEIDRSDVEALYSNAKIAVISSFYEGIGLQLYEALACNCLLACSEIKIFREQCEKFSIPINYFDPNNPFDMADKIKLSLSDFSLKSKQQFFYYIAYKRSIENTSKSWLKILNNGLVSKFDYSNTTLQPKKLFLFLQLFFLGGVWQATKDLIRELILINDKEKKFEITLGIDATQDNFCDLKEIMNVEKLEFDLVESESLPSYGIVDFDFDTNDARKKSNAFSVISNLSALKADIWFGLTDRFKYPLFPEKKYGLIVYDMIQERAPETFPEAFFPIYNEGIKPSVYYSDLIVTTNPVTQADVRKFIGHKKNWIEVVPVSCEPEKRFKTLIPCVIKIPRSAFILNISNGAMHKGIIPMLKGYAEFKRAQFDPPMLVVCGVNTEKFSPKYCGLEDYPTWKKVRELIGELGLLENIDVVFMGHVSDEELLYLFENCQAVINSSNHDNGSFNLIEGHYFGKPTISTRYDAAEWLYKRFDVPVSYFEPGDFKGLATCISIALKKPRISLDELEKIRTKLNSRDLGLHLYANRFYQLLIKLATQ